LNVTKRDQNLRRAAKSIARRTALAVVISAAAWAADSKPCAANSTSRQLDYWLGNWTIIFPGVSGSSNSKVSLSLDKCLFVENWEDGRGHSGQNMFAYSEGDKNWHGMFADNEGRVHVFTSGEVSAGVARFEGPSGAPNEAKVLNRVKIMRLAADKVEQSWEKSSDDGRSWKTVFRGEYSRTNP